MAVFPAPTTLRSLDQQWNRARWRDLPHHDGNRYEVIDGVLYVSTSPSFFHQWIIRCIFKLLNGAFDEKGLGVTAFAPVGVFMAGVDPAQPDLVLVRDTTIIRDGGIYGVPDLIVEVLSPSHPELDTRIKRSAYARAGVPEYWMVRPATRDVLVCSEPDASLADYGQTTIVHAGAILRSPTLNFEAQVADFFAGAPDTTL